MSEFLEYNYTYDRSLGSTGYFSCEPVGAFEELLDVYAARPLDTFLHDWLCRKILSFSDGEIAALPSLVSSAARVGALATLLPEIRLRAPDVAKSIRALIPEADRRGAEKPTLAVEILRMDPEDKNKASRWRANLERRAPAPRRIERKIERANLAKIAAGIPAIPEKIFDPKDTSAKALDELTRAGILSGSEMRHEASLSPIALLRKWRVKTRVGNGRNRHILNGEASSYGRGLSLARARAACLMETVERVCAYASVDESEAGVAIANRKSPFFLKRASVRELRARAERYYHPEIPVDISDIRLFWAKGQTSSGDEIWTPAQAVFLFANFDETSIFSWIGSTGLGAGNTPAFAKIAALTEIIERDSDAAEPWSDKSAFVLQSRDSRIQELLNDYRFRGINIIFQDITGETGVPAYRCFVEGRDGKIARAAAANLDGSQAAIAALTETPWPYSWANPLARSAPTVPPSPRTPVRFLEDLPNYDMGSASANLRLLEEALRDRRREALYVDISRDDLDFPVIRAFIPGYRYSSEFDELNPPPARLTGDGE